MSTPTDRDLELVYKIQVEDAKEKLERTKDFALVQENIRKKLREIEGVSVEEACQLSRELTFEAYEKIDESTRAFIDIPAHS